MKIIRVLDTMQHFKRIKKKVAILGVGYADGYPRSLSNNSYAFLKKKKITHNWFNINGLYNCRYINLTG